MYIYIVPLLQKLLNIISESSIYYHMEISVEEYEYFYSHSHCIKNYLFDIVNIDQYLITEELARVEILFWKSTRANDSREILTHIQMKTTIKRPNLIALPSILVIGD